MTRGWRSPVLHFAVGGLALFAAQVAFDERRGAGAGAVSLVERTPIVVSAARVDRMRDEFERTYGVAPTPEQLRGRIADAVQQEVLYREAVRLGLDRQDASVELRLAQKMRAVTDRPGRRPAELAREARELGLDDDVVVRRLLAEKMRIALRRDPEGATFTDEELREVMERHRERFVSPPRIDLSQVFLAADVRGDALEADAAAALAALRAGSGDAARRAGLSDAFPLGLDLESIPRTTLQGRFGKAFADEVFALEPGAWAGPVRSPYGLHVVRVERRIPAGLPPVAEVRSRLVRLAMEERAAERYATALERLRAAYPVRVEVDS